MINILSEIKNYISDNLNRNVFIKVKGIRNKNYSFDGVISAVYPNIFIVNTLDGDKSINYCDIITKDVEITIEK